MYMPDAIHTMKAVSKRTGTIFHPALKPSHDLSAGDGTSSYSRQFIKIFIKGMIGTVLLNNLLYILIVVLRAKLTPVHGIW